MQPQSDTEYKALLTEVIKKQIVILGPDITLIKARNVPGLSVDNEGNVTQITGEPQQITQSLIDQFVQLSGLIVKKTMEPLLSYHANQTSTTAQAQTPPNQQPAASPTPQAQPIPTPIQPSPPIQTQNSPIAQTQEDMHNQLDTQTQAIIDEALKQA